MYYVILIISEMSRIKQILPYFVLITSEMSRIKQTASTAEGPYLLDIAKPGQLLKLAGLFTWNISRGHMGVGGDKRRGVSLEVGGMYGFTMNVSINFRSFRYFSGIFF